MNKQQTVSKKTGAVSFGIEWTHILGPGTGYTANPVRGCLHDCKWKMPDGNIAQCYAKTVAEKFVDAYPNGFEHLSFHPEALDKIQRHTEPAGIFIDSMSDLFGQKVESEWIMKTLETVRACPQHVFFSLTKNPRRLLDFANYPDNLLVGVSAPPTQMFGKELSIDQQDTWYRTALGWLGRCSAKHKWTSIEPLSFDVSDIINQHRDGFGERAIQWAVIGAATNGSKTYQPDAAHLAFALDSLQGLPVFFKGNLSKELVTSLSGGVWREEFPKLNQ